MYACLPAYCISMSQTQACMCTSCIYQLYAGVNANWMVQLILLSTRVQADKPTDKPCTNYIYTMPL